MTTTNETLAAVLPTDEVREGRATEEMFRRSAVLDALVDGGEVSPARRESLRIALSLGADDETLAELRDAVRIARKTTIVLPAHRYEGLSRGRGWARKGTGPSAVWGEREDGGYRVGPGRWVVVGSDGFSRQDTTPWTVRHLAAGDQTWTVAR